ncbi:MAG: hypothetical protein ACLFV5_09825 [Anaerolineales bacterium]
MTKRMAFLCALCALALMAAGGVSAESVNVIKNGSFEGDFVGGVGEHWGAFNNGGPAAYTAQPDPREPVVFDGQYSQLMTLHTRGTGGSEPDRYMGLYQVADVVPDARYMFSFYGMVRSTEGTEVESQWNYRLQVGFDPQGGTDPNAVTEWTQMDWPEYELRNPGPMQSHAQAVTATGDRMTVFVRLWKKFPTVDEEVNVNIDAVSLVGPRPGESAAPEKAVSEKEIAEETGTPTEEVAMLPKTGSGTMLPLVGLLLAVVITGAAGTRLFLRLR